MAASVAHGRARGATLVELVVTIVVLAAGVTGILSVMNITTAASADPMITSQAQAIAQAHLDEILLRNFASPMAPGPEAGENRSTHDDVDDYHAMSANGCIAVSAACATLGDCVCNQYGDPIDALAGYSVAVSVQAGSVNSEPAQIVHVTVSHARFPALSVSLTGYRTEY